MAEKPTEEELIDDYALLLYERRMTQRRMCKFCGKTIEMKETVYGWRAFNLDKTAHVCNMNRTIKKRYKYK